MGNKKSFPLVAAPKTGWPPPRFPYQQDPYQCTHDDDKCPGITPAERVISRLRAAWPRIRAVVVALRSAWSRAISPMRPLPHDPKWRKGERRIGVIGGLPGVGQEARFTYAPRTRRVLFRVRATSHFHLPMRNKYTSPRLEAWVKSGDFRWKERVIGGSKYPTFLKFQN